MVRCFLSDDAGSSGVVGFGSGPSGISTDEIIGDTGTEDEFTGGSAPDSKDCSSDAGEGGSNTLLTRGQLEEWTRYIPHRS